MIIWIDGAYGIGKSTLALKLSKKIKNSYIYNPEDMGNFLWTHQPILNMQCEFDMTDIPLWREFNYKLIENISSKYKGNIIIPMTICNEECYNDIIKRLIENGVELHHFILLAKESVLEKRIVKREKEDGNNLARNNMNKCLKFFRNTENGTKIYTDEKTSDEVADEIIGIIDYKSKNNDWILTYPIKNEVMDYISNANDMYYIAKRTDIERGNYYSKCSLSIFFCLYMSCLWYLKGIIFNEKKECSEEYLEKVYNKISKNTKYDIESKAKKLEIDFVEVLKNNDDLFKEKNYINKKSSDTESSIRQLVAVIEILREICKEKLKLNIY